MSTNELPSISVESLKILLKDNNNIVLLDVRTPEEYSRGRIPTSLNLPVDNISSQITSLVPDKTMQIYLYCLSGSRSMLAAEQLVQLGYKNISNIANGLLAWKSRHYPIENDS